MYRSTIASTRRDAGIRLTSFRSWAIEDVWTECHADGVAAVAVMPDGNRILSASGGGEVRVWLLDGTLVNTFGVHDDFVNALVALPDNQHALSGSSDHTVKLFNVNDGAVLRSFKHHTDFGLCLALLPDGLRFVSGSSDKNTRIVYHGLALQ